MSDAAAIKADHAQRCYSVQADALPALCRACTARHGGVCATLSNRQLSELAKTTLRRTVHSGASLANIDEEEGSFANILAGVVKLTKVLRDGRQQIVGLQFAPDFVGRPFGKETGLITEAVTDLEVCTFPKRVLERMLSDNPALEHKLYEQALAELDDARDLLLTLGRKTAQERTATFLLLIARHSPSGKRNPGEGGRVRFELPLTRAEIADFLGLTIETVSRQLTRLKINGLIVMEKSRSITVPDMDDLAVAAGE